MAKVFEKINIKIVICMQECTPVRNFGQFGERQNLGPSIPKETL